jgi:hypothetical protein
VRLFKDDLCADIHQDAVAHLRRPLHEIIELLKLDVAEVSDNLEVADDADNG